MFYGKQSRDCVNKKKKKHDLETRTRFKTRERGEKKEKENREIVETAHRQPPPGQETRRLGNRYKCILCAPTRAIYTQHE